MRNRPVQWRCRSVEAAAARAVEKPAFDVAERFVGGVEQAFQIIALGLIFFSQDDFGVAAWRIYQARNALEPLFAGSFGTVRIGMPMTVIHTIRLQLTPPRLFLTHTRS